MKFLENFDLALRLKKIIKYDKICNAYLFFGEDFVLKKEIAKFFARLILCKKDRFFCRSCSSCDKFLSGNHPDFFEVGQEFKKGQSFSIFDVRDIIKKAYIKPNEGEYKIFLLNDIDSLLNSSLNALLKILEDPPNGVVFILTATNKNNVLKTVLSRCVDFFVPVCSKEDSIKYLDEKKIKTEGRDITKILNLSDGRLDLLEKYLTIKEAEKAVSVSFELLDLYLNCKEFKFLSLLQKFENNLEFLFLVFYSFLRWVQIYLKNLKEFEVEVLDRLNKVSNSIQNTIEDLKNNANIALALSSFCCKLF